jgi:hypothetical protein
MIGAKPNPHPERLGKPMHRSVIRLLQSAILAIGLAAVPVATVVACSCAMTEFDEAIATADVAVVGVAVASAPAGGDELGEAVLTTWQLSRSRDPLDTDAIAIRSVKDSGANCGISFASGERWLVLAYRGEQGLETNGCMMNRRLDGSDPEAETAVASMLVAVTPTEVKSSPGVEIPVPVLVLLATGMLVAGASLVAFRRSSPS